MGIFGWIGGLFGGKDAAGWAAEARDLLAKGKAGRALASAEKAVTLAPEDVDLLVLRSEVLRAAGDPARAAEDLLAVLEKAPRRAGSILAALEALESSATRPEAIWLHAWGVYAEKGDWARAGDRVKRIAGRGAAAVESLRARCRAMAEKGGDRTAALFALAILAHEKGEYSEAAARLAEAAKTDGKRFGAFAERSLSDIAARSPGAPGVLRDLASLRLGLGKQAEARALVQETFGRDPGAALFLLGELRAAGGPAAEFALEQAAALDAGGAVPVGLSGLLAEGLLAAGRGPEASTAVLRALKSHPPAAEDLLPLAVRCMRENGGLDGLEAHARASALAGDSASALQTLGLFAEADPARAWEVLGLLPEKDRAEAAPMTARVRAGRGEHAAAAADLRRWAAAAKGARAKEALPHARAVSDAHPKEAAWALLLFDLLTAAGDVPGAGKVLLRLVDAVPAQAPEVEPRAEALIARSTDAFEARLAAARAGLVRAADPGACLAHFRGALDSAPAREAEVLAAVEGGMRWASGIEPLELFRADLLLRAGRVEDGLARVEEIVLRNPARGDEALAALKTWLQGAGSGDPRGLLAEHRVRKALGDAEGSVAPLRRVAELAEDRREEVMTALDAVVADDPACRGAHRAGADLAAKIGRPPAEVLRRLEALLEVPTPPRDTEYVTRRAAAVQAGGASVAGHRLLVRCHLFAQRWPLAVEEVRRMVALDPATRAEAAGLLGHVVSKAPQLLEPRFLLASLHAALGAVDAAREALAGAAPRTEEVFEAYRRLVGAYAAHRGARMDLVDALVAERRLDEALEEAGKVIREAGGAGPDLVERIDRVLSLSPEYAPALYALADVHHAAVAWEPEIAALRRILRIAPGEAEAVLGRLDAILERDPRCVEASLEVVRLVPMHGKAERAAPEARRALQSASTPAEAGRLADAMKPLEKRLGGDEEFREALATALSRAGRTGPAVKAWTALLGDAPGRAGAAAKELGPLAAVPGEDGVEALRALAVARLLSGKPAEACEAADRFLAKRPKAPEEARALFQRILAAHPASREAADGCARSAALAGDPAGAVAARLHEIRHHPGRRKDVGKDLEELRAAFPKEAGVSLALAESVRLPLDLHEDAAADLEKALDLDPSCHRKALELAEVVLARDPRSVRGTRARARALAAAARYDEAVAGFRALADLDSRCLADALAGLDAILRDGPANPVARYRRAEVLREIGRPKDAAKALDGILAETAPGDPMEYRALCLLALARQGMGDFDGALEALRLVGSRHPKEPSVAPRVRANHAARVAARAAGLRAQRIEGKPTEADLDLAESLLESGDAAAAPTAAGPEPAAGPARARWRTLRGRAFLRLGAAADAVEELEEAVKIEGVEEAATPAARDALFYCGVAHLRTGELIKGIRRLEQAARVAPAHRRVREVLDRVYSEERRHLERPLAFTTDLESLPREGPGA